MKLAVRLWTDHAQKMSCLQCDLPYLLEVSRPPDPELVDLIEQAFIEGQIDSQKTDLAYIYLRLETANGYCMYIQYNAGFRLASKNIMWDVLWYFSFSCYIFTLSNKQLSLISGGERGIRTLEGVLALTPLAGERFRPLSHLSDTFYSCVCSIHRERDRFGASLIPEVMPSSRRRSFY